MMEKTSEGEKFPVTCSSWNGGITGACNRAVADLRPSAVQSYVSDTETAASLSPDTPHGTSTTRAASPWCRVRVRVRVRVRATVRVRVRVRVS